MTGSAFPRPHAVREDASARALQDIALLNGLYKVEYAIDDASGRSVMYAHDGKLLGGNSAFAHLGSFEERDGEIVCEVTTQRHNDDPNYKPLMGADVAAINLRGRDDGKQVCLEGQASPLPGSVFRAVMTPLDDETEAVVDAVDNSGGIVNGLYSIHIRLLDGVDGGLTGVMLLNDGRILGGDAFFYYLGSYTSAGGRWKGEIVNQEHTPAKGENPVFGGYEVGIGFSGSCSGEEAELEATALCGKRSLRLTATLKLMRRA